MATYKRRIVYLSDEEWAKAQERAKRYGQTASSYIRSLIVGGRVAPDSLLDAVDAYEAKPNPFLRPGIDKAMREFRPAPKPSKR